MTPISRAQEALDRVWRPGAERRARLDRAAGGSAAARASVELAERRLSTLIDRQAGPLVLAGVAAVVIAPWAGLAVLAILVATELADTLLNLHVMHRAPPDDLAADRLRPLQILNAFLGAGGHAAYVALCWVLGPPELRILCFAFIGLALVYTALHVNPRRDVLWTRIAVYSAMMAALCLADLLAPGGLDSTRAWVQAVVALTIGYRLWTLTELVLEREARRVAEARAAEAARDAAIRASDARMRYFAMVSHELRTPLNGILGMTQGLLAGRLEPEQREKAEVIAESGRTLTALLSDVLDLSKMDAGRLDVHPAPESFHAGLRHIVTLYRPLAEEKSIALRLEVAPGVPDWLEIDGVRLRQCLANLVANAIKFTDEGEVVVSVLARRVAEVPERLEEIAVEVRDTGIGLSAEAEERLFEPFAQADPSVPHQYGGTGLGLSIARRLARLMGGDVIGRGAEDGGSVFTFTFRAAHAVPPYAATEMEPGEATARGAPGLTVLVADDVETNRAVARLFLEPLRIRAVEARDGRAALEALREGGVDAALVDLRMPGLSGEEVLRAVRAGEAGDPQLPLLAVTADHMADTEALRAAGFDGVILKPMDQRALQTALMGVLAARLVGVGGARAGGGGLAWA